MFSFAAAANAADILLRLLTYYIYLCSPTCQHGSGKTTSIGRDAPWRVSTGLMARLYRFNGTSLQV